VSVKANRGGRIGSSAGGDAYGNNYGGWKEETNGNQPYGGHQGEEIMHLDV
jgi:hypothetical protein